MPECGRFPPQIERQILTIESVTSNAGITAMQAFTKDVLGRTSLLIDDIAGALGHRRSADRFFESLEQTKVLMRAKDRLSHSPVLI
jgi:hypothetical protein